MDNEEINQYYEWARKIKTSMNGYISMEKIKATWLRKSEDATENHYLKIFRVLCLFYIEHMMVPAILTSKKIGENGKCMHLSIRRKLLLAIRERDG